MRIAIAVPYVTMGSTVANISNTKERQFPFWTSKHFNNMKQSLHLMQEPHLNASSIK